MRSVNGWVNIYLEFTKIIQQQIISPKSLIILCLALLLAGCKITVSHSQPATAPFKIEFLGDLLLGDAAQPYLDQHGYIWPFDHIIDLIDGDYLIANLEGPITTRSQPWDPDQRWSYNAQPQAAQALAEIGIDALGLSNNHAMDRGPKGVADTLTHLQANNLAAFGAGLNLSQAQQPLIIRTPHGNIAVVALGYDWGEDRTASDESAGTVPLSITSIQHGFDLAQTAGADWVVGYLHWGNNYRQISDNQRRWAGEFAQAGYDLIIGHGAHSLQSIEIIEGMPVIYSLGNSVFGTPGRFSEEFPGFGLVLTAELGPGGFDRLLLNCIQTDNQIVDFQPRPCTSAQVETVFYSLYPDLIIEDAFAVLTW